MAVGLLFKCMFHMVVGPFPGGGKVVGGRRLSAVVGRRSSVVGRRRVALGLAVHGAVAQISITWTTRQGRMGDQLPERLTSSLRARMGAGSLAARQLQTKLVPGISLRFVREPKVCAARRRNSF